MTFLRAPQTRSAPSPRSSQPNSGLPEFGHLMIGRSRINPTSAERGGVRGPSIDSRICSYNKRRGRFSTLRHATPLASLRLDSGFRNDAAPLLDVAADALGDRVRRSRLRLRAL